METELFQECILEKRFEISRIISNSVLGIAQNRYKVVKTMQHHYKKNLDSFTCQKIASRLWTALDKVLFSDGESLHFKKYGQGLNSLEGKTNGTGIKYQIDTHTLEWNGLLIKVQSKLNDYEITALIDKGKYCRIIRKFIRGKFKYILQLVLEGIPVLKVNKKTGLIKNTIGIGTVGLDIGTQTVAYTSDFNSKLLELATRVQNIEDQKRRLLRYMNRSKRAANPKNFNSKGTIKKSIKLEWNFSKKYIKARAVLKDLYRKQDHNIMVNEIISQGSTVKVETMCFKGLQKFILL